MMRAARKWRGKLTYRNLDAYLFLKTDSRSLGEEMIDPPNKCATTSPMDRCGCDGWALASPPATVAAPAFGAMLVLVLTAAPAPLVWSSIEGRGGSGAQFIKRTLGASLEIAFWSGSASFPLLMAFSGAFLPILLVR